MMNIENIAVSYDTAIFMAQELRNNVEKFIVPNQTIISHTKSAPAKLFAGYMKNIDWDYNSDGFNKVNGSALLDSSGITSPFETLITYSLKLNSNIRYTIFDDFTYGIRFDEYTFANDESMEGYAVYSTRRSHDGEINYEKVTLLWINHQFKQATIFGSLMQRNRPLSMFHRRFIPSMYDNNIIDRRGLSWFNHKFNFNGVPLYVKDLIAAEGLDVYVRSPESLYNEVMVDMYNSVDPNKIIETFNKYVSETLMESSAFRTPHDRYSYLIKHRVFGHKVHLYSDPKHLFIMSLADKPLIPTYYSGE